MYARRAMIHAFDGYRLDTDTRELRFGDRLVPVEPQVFALLWLLIENRERLVSKDEIIERIWDGRIVSESAVASRVKSARQAIGDSGEAQRLIRTTHKLGFRFVAEVESTQAPRDSISARADAARVAAVDEPARRPSIAVLPFTLVGIAGPYGSIADALPHDLIVELSRLRWLFVIARGSSFQFRGSDAAIDRVRSALNVRYCLSGVVEIELDRMTVTVELCDTDNNGIVWSEYYETSVGAVHEVRAEIARAVVNALELQIPANEARRALKSPENLDAWSAYHLGLHHLYQFNPEANGRATALFEQAIAKEPGFARAYAGLSFAHFESGFLHFADDISQAAALAHRFAEQSLEHEPFDPFGNLVMGRAAWLRGDLEASLPWLDRANDLSPSYAQGKYSRAWAGTLLGEGAGGRALVDAALKLSPLDPLLYGMLGVRSFSHMALDQPEEAALWGERAARAPRAHPLIELIAAVAHGLNGDDARADAWARLALNRRPDLNGADFLKAFPFRDPITRQRISEALARLNL
jgi:TolB-like protein